MPDVLQIKAASRNHIKQIAQEQFAIFEQREAEFRKQDRRQRANELDIPANTSDWWHNSSS